MLARVAEHIYWMARYMERAEDMARLINVNTNLLLDLPKGISPGWEPLIAITGAQNQYASQDRDERSVLRFLLSDPDSPVSILACLAAARENARTIRDQIPREAWEQINAIYLYAKEQAQGALGKRGRYPFLNEVIRQSQSLVGILAGCMNHDEGYLFLQIGRNLERADMSSRIIDIRSANLLPAEISKASFDNIQWMSVLKSLTAYQMYRREMQLRVRREDVLRFLIQSETFPRAITHCMDQVAASLQLLSQEDGLLATIRGIRRQLEQANLVKLKQTELQHFIDELQVGFGQVHLELQQRFFSRHD